MAVPEAVRRQPGQERQPGRERCILGGRLAAPPALAAAGVVRDQAAVEAARARPASPAPVFEIIFEIEEAIINGGRAVDLGQHRPVPRGVRGRVSGGLADELLVTLPIPGALGPRLGGTRRELGRVRCPARRRPARQTGGALPTLRLSHRAGSIGYQR